MINSNHKYIKGIIRVYDKDKSGVALQLFIETEEFQKYVIDNTVGSQQLFSLIGEEIVVNCIKYAVPHESLPHVIINNFHVVYRDVIG